MSVITYRNAPDYRSKEYLDVMRNYLENLKQSTGKEAVEDARQSLIRTGVADKDGRIKEKIVSWEEK